jgi:hypothetical protein
VGRYTPQSVSLLRTAPTLLPSFLLAQTIFKSNLLPYTNPNILKPSHPSYPPAYDDGTERSETLAYKIQMLGNYPEESIEHTEHDESLKSRINLVTLSLIPTVNVAIFDY